MTHMRPGTKVPFWTPGYKNKPFINPPGLLRLFSAVCILSIVGVLVYATAKTLSVTHGTGVDGAEAIYIALVHVVLPVCIIYTVATNSPLSRILITLYCVIVYVATVTGSGITGSFSANVATRIISASVVLIAVLIWMYRSPKMRVYYALISNAVPPEDLGRPAEEIIAPTRLERALTRAEEAIMPYVEMLVGLFIVVVCIYAFLVAYS